MRGEGRTVESPMSRLWNDGRLIGSNKKGKRTMIYGGKVGEEAMVVWGKAWRPGHLPRWVKARLSSATKKVFARRKAKPTGDPIEILRAVVPKAERGLWVHWGSIVPSTDDGLRRLVTQPDDDYLPAAREFAKTFGLHLSVVRPGPWGPGTAAFIFDDPEESAAKSYRRDYLDRWSDTAAYEEQEEVITCPFCGHHNEPTRKELDAGEWDRRCRRCRKYFSVKCTTVATYLSKAKLGAWPKK